MGKPVCKFPRQPTGPSGFGSTGVRRAQSQGGDYQRTRPNTDTLAIQSGDFSRVIVEDVPEYVTTAPIGVDDVVRDTKNHRQAFQKSKDAKSITGTYSFGPGGLYVDEVVSPPIIIYPEYEYEIYPGTTATVDFDSEQTELEVYFGGYKLKSRLVTFYPFTYTYLPLIPGQSMFFKLGDEVSYWGKHPTYGRCFVSLSVHIFGRDDSQGRNLSDLRLVRHREKNNGVFEFYRINPEDFSRADSEFMWITHQVVLKDFTVLIFAELFFRPGPKEVGEDYIPKFWMATTPNNESFGSLTYHDMTAGVFAGARQPTTGVTPVEHYTTVAGRQYQFDLSATMYTMIVEAVANDAFVMAWQQRMPAGWRMRVARVVLSGGVPTATMAYESSDVGTRSSVQLWQSIAHLGNGFVLAKIVSGSQGINLDVTFRLSSDGGASWGAPFNPIGFSSPLKNQYLGNFRVHKALTSEKPGRVLVNAWDVEKAAYHVWASDDNGLTWTRKGKIYKPEAFVRVDTMLAGDGGGNFDDLVPGPIYSDKIDVALPDRYKDRS